MNTEFKRNVRDMSVEISAHIKDTEIMSVFNPQDIMIIARNKVAQKLADKITDILFPSLERSLKELSLGDKDGGQDMEGS